MKRESAEFAIRPSQMGGNATSSSQGPTAQGNCPEVAGVHVELCPPVSVHMNKPQNKYLALNQY